MPTALLVDDDHVYAAALAELIEQENYEVRTCGGVRQALTELTDYVPDVVLVDLLLPDGSGMELVHKIESLALHTHVFVITAHAELDSTVAALRAGVEDYLTKPLDLQHLRKCLQAARAETSAGAEPRDGPPKALDGLGPLVGSSSAMRELYASIKKAAPTNMSVFLSGESGTGKELAASAVHACSDRSDKPFLAINCGAVPANLIATELFGHERGAFTDARSQHKGYFERADGGTLFLDEITEMPLELQVQLLRVLENRCITRVGGLREIPVDVRIIAATNRNPRVAVSQGRLREDLLFRLMAFPIAIAPLRRRSGDIGLLAEKFLRQHNEENGTAKVLTTEALRFLEGYSWPGNVRELKNAIGHAYILADDALQPSHFPQGVEPAIEEDGALLQCLPGTPIEQFEKRFILATLDHHKGNKRRTAETLGISLKTLYNRLNEYRAQS